MLQLRQVVKMSIIFVAASIFTISLFAQATVKSALTTQSTPQQTSQSIFEPLSVGDDVPDIEFNLLNYPTSKARLSDFRGKLVILDFWATWCTSCIAQFPKNDSLYEAYKDRVVFLAVSYESENKIKSFISKNNFVKNVSFPIVFGDSASKQLFPHVILPHYVWIDSSQKVYSFTSSHEVSLENIKAYFENENYNGYIKKDIKFNYADPKLNISHREIESFNLFHSSLYSYIEGIVSMEGPMAEKNRKRYSFINVPILSIYRRALSNSLPNFNRRIILEVGDVNKYIPDLQNYELWLRKFGFSYEISSSLTTSDSKINKLIIEDINRYLGLNGRIEKRHIKVWELRLTDKKKIINTEKAFLEKWRDQDITGPYLIDLRNQTIDVLIAALNRPFNPTHNIPPIINGINESIRIDINLSINNLYNLGELVLKLKPFGLTLIEREIEIEMFVLSESYN